MITLIYILMLFGLIVATIAIFQHNKEITPIMAIPFFLFFILTAAIAVKEVKTEITNPLIEKNEYRIIITANGREFQYKDAYTVKNAENIKKVYFVRYLNGWGFDSAKDYVLEIQY